MPAVEDSVPAVEESVPAVEDSVPDVDSSTAATTVNVDSDDINTCHISHILDQAVTNVNSRIRDTSKQISHNCPDGDTLNSGETCYLYCNSFKSDGSTPTTADLDGARIGTEDDPSKSSKISCGSVSTGQELNCGPDDSRIEGDMCPHTHHIYLKCSEDSEEIEIDFEIDAQTATAGGLAATALAVASYLIFL